MRTVTLIGLLWSMISAAWLGCREATITEEGERGSAEVVVLRSAVSTVDIDRLVVTVNGDGISPDIVVELPERPDGRWYGMISDIPAGADRTFTAKAYDDAGVLLFSGAASDVTIEDETTISVMIQLQQVNPPDPFDNAVPIINSFVVSPMTVGPGEDVVLEVEATDADPEDTLTYVWTVTGGSFTDTASPETVWTAPAEPGIYTVTISVSDPHGAVAELSADIAVSVPTGNAWVDIAVNSSPSVLGLVPTPTRIDVGESVRLELTVEDPEGDALSFEWSTDCDGTFDDIHLEDATFTLSSLAVETCTLTVVVDDGNGGSNHAGITIQTGPGIAPVEVPEGCTGVIDFPDPNLRAALGLPSGDIYFEDVWQFSEIYAPRTDISDLTGIQCLVNLDSITLYGNSISDLSPLSKLSKLGYLNLFGNNISDISPLANLTDLTYLALDFTSISDISPLANLTKLNHLSIGGKRISNPSVLSTLINLTYLGLFWDSIIDLSVLANLSKLTKLHLNYNSISDISPLANLINLTHLQIVDNEISDISPLANLTNLRFVHLNENNVSDISPLANLVNLSYLNLQNNNISDISPFVTNDGIGSGHHIIIYNNLLDCGGVTTLGYIAELERRGVYLEHDCGCAYECQLDLVSNQTDCDGIVSLMSPVSNGVATLVADLEEYKILTVSTAICNPEGWTLNIGNSPGNNGYAGDNGSFSNDSELQVYNSKLSVYANDYGGSTELYSDADFAPIGSCFETDFIIADGRLVTTRPAHDVESEYIFRLDRSDDEGEPDALLFVGLNRVIANTARSGSGVERAGFCVR